MNKNIHIPIITIALAIAALTCGSPPTEISTSTQTPVCYPAGPRHIENIRAGVQDIATGNDVDRCFAVRSKDFERVYMVACLLYGPGMENGVGPGVWAISGDPDNPGLTYSVNNFAKEFSTWPDASKTDATIESSAHGVSEAIQCSLSQK